jgi:predicted amidohydrolase
LYSKKFLHADEEEFFISLQSSTSLIGNKTNIALAVCYELSILAHAENAVKNGAEIYIVSAAKSVDGVDRAIERLSQIATEYSITVLMSNCIGQSGGMECGGKTSVWNKKGILTGQLNDTNEGILIFDTDRQEVIEKQYKITAIQTNNVSALSGTWLCLSDPASITPGD